jgi:hypothetical protein
MKTALLSALSLILVSCMGIPHNSVLPKAAWNDPAHIKLKAGEVYEFADGQTLMPTEDAIFYSRRELLDADRRATALRHEVSRLKQELSEARRGQPTTVLEGIQKSN